MPFPGTKMKKYLETIGSGGVTTRRDLMQARIESAADGGWHIRRDNADRLRLWRRLEGGYYADYVLSTPQIGQTPGPATNAGQRRATCLIDMGVGRLMTYSPLNVGTTFTGTWLGIPAYFAAGTIPDITEGVDAYTGTATVTAGQTNITNVTPALSGVNTRWSNRRIVIPGAGTSGAEYVGTLGNTASSGATGILNAAPATSVANASITLYPKRHYSNTAGAGVTYVAPVGADSVGVVHSVAATGGVWTVSIDGDLTRANCLPTAQDAVTLGHIPASSLTTNGGDLDPTTRVLDFYSPYETLTVWQALATGLSTGEAHTVVLTDAGHKRPESVNTRAFLSGFGYGTPALTPSSPGVSVFHTTRVSPTFPTHELAIDHQPTGATAKAFVGGSNHGYEYGPAPTIVVDGVTTTLAAGETAAVGQFATITVTSDAYHPEVTGSPTFGIKRTYQLAPTGLVVRQVVTAKIATVVDSAYLVMFTVKGQLDRAQLDVASDVLDISDYESPGQEPNAYMGAGNNTAAVWWDADGDVAVAVIVPTAEQITAGFSDPVGVKASIRHITGGSKFYLRRTGTLAIDDVLESEATYILARFPDGAGQYFPVS